MLQWFGAGLLLWEASEQDYMYLEFEVSEFRRGEDGGDDKFFAARMVVVTTSSLLG